ncbi:MAG: hypothetical protein ABIQ40_03985 [Bacteroidia bacterium]
MSTLKIYIEQDDLYRPEVVYTVGLLSVNKNIPLQIVEHFGEAEVIIGHSENADVKISREFFQNIRSGIFDHRGHFDKSPLIMNAAKPDYLSSIFYMVNALQEYDGKQADQLGRFPYKSSYQKKFDVIHENLVQEYLDQLFLQLFSKRKEVPVNTPQSSRLFLSHDIDDVYGSWTEDVFFALKKARLADLSRLLITFMLRKPDWFNFDQVMNVNDEHDFKSMFLFIVHKGKTASGLKNADYDINSPSIRNSILKIKERGFEIGLHKSVSSSSFGEELAKLNEPVICNRYHYLKFSWPDAIEQLEKSRLSVDCSLGFAEEFGLRNNYARPFVPYNVSARRKSTFVEVPLQVMDRTFYGYKKQDPVTVADSIISFFERYKHDSVLSLLWHNNFYTSVKFDGYLASLKKVLSYLHDQQIKSITAEEIRKQYLNA